MIEIYFRAFVNKKQNNWVKLLPIAMFVYNNIKNFKTSYNSFELNYEFFF